MNYLFVANWKMNMHANQAISYCTNHRNDLQSLAINTKNTIVICPSFVSLAPIKKIFHNTSLLIGAQNCSDHSSGAYTGQISAKSLQEIGCNYCIIGHSEQRTYCHITNETVAAQAEQLIAHKIKPIICIGESEEDYKNKTSQEILQKQLKPIVMMLKKSPVKKIPITIAYEPTWAIGNNIIPPLTYLSDIFTWLQQHVSALAPKQSISLLYGGSVDESSISELKKLPHLKGFLIGRASTNFNLFKQIILRSNNSPTSIL
jgi:triosephosphate isomerase